MISHPFPVFLIKSTSANRKISSEQIQINFNRESKIFSKLMGGKRGVCAHFIMHQHEYYKKFS